MKNIICMLLLTICFETSVVRTNEFRKQASQTGRVYLIECFGYNCKVCFDEKDTVLMNIWNEV